MSRKIKIHGFYLEEIQRNQVIVIDFVSYVVLLFH